MRVDSGAPADVQARLSVVVEPIEEQGEVEGHDGTAIRYRVRERLPDGVLLRRGTLLGDLGWLTQYVAEREELDPAVCQRELALARL